MKLNEYLRLSRRKGGTSISRQRTQNEREREAIGATLGKRYEDPSRSASRSYDGTQKRKREDFEALMADMRSDAFDADGLQIWESSRFSRQEEEWLTMINTMAAKGLKLYVTTHHRFYNPADGTDRSALIDQANKSAHETWLIHLRTTETAAENALAGRPHGRAPYGLRPVYDPDTGRLDTWVADEEPRFDGKSRAHVIRELFKLLELGRSFNSISKEFRKQGFLNKSGGELSPAHLRVFAVKEVYAGLRNHKGTVRNGTWDGIVTEERFWAVQRIIRDPSRTTRRAGRAKHTLTGALRCGPCIEEDLIGTIIVAADTIYKCKLLGHVQIDKPAVDTLVVPVMLDWLSRPDIIEELRAKSNDDPEVSKIRARIAQARTERQENQNAAGKTTSTTAIVMLAEAIDRLEKLIVDLQIEERRLTVPPQLLSFLDGEKSILETWTEADVSVRREVANIVLTPAYAGQPLILRNPVKGTPAPASKRLAWRRVKESI